MILIFHQWDSLITESKGSLAGSTTTDSLTIGTKQPSIKLTTTDSLENWKNESLIDSINNYPTTVNEESQIDLGNNSSATVKKESIIDSIINSPTRGYSTTAKKGSPKYSMNTFQIWWKYFSFDVSK